MIHPSACKGTCLLEWIIHRRGVQLGENGVCYECGDVAVIVRRKLLANLSQLLTSAQWQHSSDTSDPALCAVYFFSSLFLVQYSVRAFLRLCLSHKVTSMYHRYVLYYCNNMSMIHLIIFHQIFPYPFPYWCCSGILVWGLHHVVTWYVHCYSMSSSLSYSNSCFPRWLGGTRAHRLYRSKQIMRHIVFQCHTQNVKAISKSDEVKWKHLNVSWIS